MHGKLISRTYQILEEANDGISKACQFFIFALISANVLMAVIETEASVADQHAVFIYAFEIFSIVVFTVEYAARIAVCRVNPKYAGKKYALLRFALSPMMLVDLAAILPFFLPFVDADVRVVRILRLLRLFRIFKLVRYSESLRMFGYVLREKTGDLVVALFILLIALLFASSLMYYAEREAQPEAFYSIPASMWWGVITLTTIGYGDTFPVTVAGRVIAGGVAVLGIAVYAVPSGILASAFIEGLKKTGREDESRAVGRTSCPAARSWGGGGGATGEDESRAVGRTSCPHCGKEIDS